MSSDATGPRPEIPYWHLWTDARDGTRIEQGPGEFSLGEDQGCTSADGRRGHRSGTIGDLPAVLMTVQLHIPPTRTPSHFK